MLGDMPIQQYYLFLVKTFLKGMKSMLKLKGGGGVSRYMKFT